MCSCAPASTFNMSSYIGEGRYAVFTSPKSLRPQPVSPERSESWRRGREPAADSTNSHLHLLHAPHLLAPAFGHEPCNSKVGTICTCHLSAILHLPTTLGMWASTSSASSKTRGVRSPRPSCATCWKSHESLTYCQSLKSDSSLHLLASADASGIFAKGPPLVAGSFDLIQMPPVSKLRPQLMLVCVDHLIRNNVANQPNQPTKPTQRPPDSHYFKPTKPWPMSLT